MAERVRFNDIKDLGFKATECYDRIYLEEYGFEYIIYTLDLTNKIYVDWARETGLCELIRIDSPKECNIKKRVVIENIDHLKRIIDFYTD